MSLIICPECNKRVSVYADKCPNCGCPMSKILELLQDPVINIQDNYGYKNENTSKRELLYQVFLNDSNNNTLKIARYLRIFKNIGISESMSLVSKIPGLLLDDVPESTIKIIEEALKFLCVEFEIKCKDEYIEKIDSTSKKIVYLGTQNGSKPDYTSYIYVAREYNLDLKCNLSEAPIVVRDGVPDDAAIVIQKELKLIGMYSQIINSYTDIKPIVSSLAPPKPRTSKCPLCESSHIRSKEKTKGIMASMGYDPFLKNTFTAYECLSCGYIWEVSRSIK